MTGKAARCRVSLRLMDAMHNKLREDGRVVPKAVYTILGINTKGLKDVLGIYISESKGANFWLQVLTDLSKLGAALQLF
jgi:putative transposase